MSDEGGEASRIDRTTDIRAIREGLEPSTLPAPSELEVKLDDMELRWLISSVPDPILPLGFLRRTLKYIDDQKQPTSK